MNDDGQRATGRLRISQQMIPIVTVGVALAGLQLATIADIRAERSTARAA